MLVRCLFPVLLGAALLAGCAPDPAVDRQAILDEVMANYRANVAGMRPLTAPAIGEGEARAAMPALTGTPTQTAQLLGQPPSALRQLLGEPSLRRTEGEAEIWLYQSPYCHLDIMLYQERGAPAPRVTYANARASGVERRTEASCLQEVAEARLRR
ncbi:hypothetical protein HMPREF9946_03553 [Acetobacteraceae bacterium AT-5844]|nr:hypothetical protein HMPREF9946_03553 [Acetobacteraceae bacterium AT-5844]